MASAEAVHEQQVKPNWCSMRERIWELYAAESPAAVIDAAWSIIEEEMAPQAAGLWQRDTDSQLFVRAAWNLSKDFARTRLGKMDSGIGQTIMEVGEPLLVTDVTQTPDPARQYPVLRANERRALSRMQVRTALVLPVKGDFALMLLFRQPTTFTDQQIGELAAFADHFVTALLNSHQKVADSTLVEIGELLSASADGSQHTMDRIAELARDMVPAGGVSIFLTHPDGKRLVLAGTTGLDKVGRPEDYSAVTYKLERGYGLTSDVFLSGDSFRWPDLGHPTTAERFQARGIAWRKRWNEAETFAPDAVLAVMIAPLVYSYRDDDGSWHAVKVGVIRAAVRRPPQAYFAPEEQEALERVASMVGKHVGAMRRSGAESLEAMQRIAHQFVSPLNALLWAVERLRRKLATITDQRLPMVAAVADLALLAASYGRNFELIARIWSGKQEGFDLQPVRLAQAVVRTIRNYQPVAESRGISIWMADDSLEGSVDKLGEAMIDRDAFGQTLVNVIDNAVKYGVSAREITITGRKLKNDQVALDCSSVSRIPLREEDVPLAFNKGWRAPQARELLVAGTGTGLWIAREIMRRHGGDLLGEPSQPENGGHRVVFTLVLDAAK